MPTVFIGARRLYDALGAEVPPEVEIIKKVDLSIGKTITLYVGPKPPFGITSLEANRYIIPGRGEYTLLHTNNGYEAPCFLEVSVSIPQEITIEQMSKLKGGCNNTSDSLLKKASEQFASIEPIIDAVSGVLGLTIHRQFVLKPLVENVFLSGDFEVLSLFEGPPLETLDTLKLNENLGSFCNSLLNQMLNTSDDDLNAGGTILHWLLRAWREPDEIAKFVYLFIPLEAILPSNAKLATESKIGIELLEKIVKKSSDSNRDCLLGFLARTKAKFGPTLNSRFEELARNTSLPGWEIDVKAFKKYNRMRNDLLHKGKRGIQSGLRFEEHTRTLQDLVERYVSIALLGSREVYQSSYRPKRASDT